MPKVMGVLNVTPDSFFDQGSYFSVEKAIAHGKELCEQGADLIDIGGASFRPFAQPVTEQEELGRVVPVIEALSSLISTPLSIDTDKPLVAHEAVKRGVSLINNIGGFRDPAMVEVAKKSSADLCLMHMQGTPQTMQIDPSYPKGVVVEILDFFDRQIDTLTRAGIDRNRIILDPGIGFGKTVEHNLLIFKSLEEFKKFGLRLLIGASRKSFMGKLLQKQARELLPATLAIHTISLLAGVDIIRVHDVEQHRDIVDLVSHFCL